MTFHRSGDWKKNAKELDIRSKTAQFPDTTKGIDAVRDLLTETGVDIEKCAIRRRPRHSRSQHTNGTAVESSTANLARDRLGRTLIYSVVRPSESSPSRSGSRHHLQQAEWLDFFESC